MVVVAVVAGMAAFAAPAGGVAGFGDVESGRYFSVPVQWMVDEDITTGTTLTCFSPGELVTRGQAAAFLWRMEGSRSAPPHPFADVHRAWQHAPVSWLFAEGITTGTSGTTYSPDDTLTRGQFAALLYRLAGEPAPASGHPFADIVASWQQDAVAWMFEQGITVGTSDTEFSPDGGMTRGEIATFLYRYNGSPPVTLDPTTPVCDASFGGLDILFMGDSFFAPVAEEMATLAPTVGIFDHTQSVVFSPGSSGSPEGLWDQPGRRSEIQSILDEGTTDVLGMIYHRDHPELDGYRNWIDYALAANPDTAFFVGVSWIGDPQSFDAATYAGLTQLGYSLVVVPLIDDLRAEYPEATIFAIPYGFPASELYSRLDAGDLPDVDGLIDGRDGIFRDNRGHAGPILEDLAALMWLGLLYDVDLTAIDVGDRWATDLEAIAHEIIAALDPAYTAPN